MLIVRASRAITYQRRISDVLRAHEKLRSTDERCAYQLLCFNKNWEEIVANVPYYSQLRGLKLPKAFRSWEEFREVVPITTRLLVQQYSSAMSNQKRKPDFHRTTGGSTAEPIQLPAWRSESRFATADLWYARGQYGISPSARLFALWGHSHLMGSGVRGWINRAKRNVRDGLINIYRYSAYDLSSIAMVKAAVEMQRFRPDFVLGYSSVLDTFARVNSERRSELRELNVKAVIGAAEGFPFPDSVARLEDLFDAPVAMEYGSVETNLIAHTRKTGGYEVFWWRYLVELGTSKSSLGGQIAYVTSLYPRCFPLIRYELGDELVCNSASDNTVGIHEFDRVLGRCNDYVTIPSGDSFHSELFTHAVRGCKQVLGYQLQQSSSGVKLALKPGPDFDESVILRIKYSLLNVDRRLEAVRIVTVADLIRTRAGKTPMVVRL